MKQYMVIERFKDGCFDAAYERFHTNGRLLPDGLNYLNSWVNKDNNICFQIMETNNPELFEIWFKRWDDLVHFELIEID
jgi:hypothetical protein